MGRPGGLQQALSELSASKSYLYMLYLAAAFVSSVVLQLRFSHQYEAAWIYRVTPIARPGAILFGGFLAVLMQFVLPAFALATCMVLAIWGVQVLDDIPLAMAVTLMFGIIQTQLIGRRLPFSQPITSPTVPGAWANPSYSWPCRRGWDSFITC